MVAIARMDGRAPRPAQNSPSAPPAWCTRSNSGWGMMPKKIVAAPARTATRTTSGCRPPGRGPERVGAAGRCEPALGVELRRSARQRRQRAARGAPGRGAARALRRRRRLAHPHRRHHRQVVAERDHRADHDRHAQPRVAARDRRVDQVELADEARRRGDARERQHRDRHRPRQPRALASEAGDRVERVAETGFAFARDDHRERRHVHEQVHRQVEDRRGDAQLAWRRRCPRACSPPARPTSTRACASARTARARRRCRRGS